MEEEGMGEEIVALAYTREARQHYREKVQQDLDVFEQMLAHHSFDYERPLTGMEIELSLVDEDYLPRLNNAAVLERIADSRYQTELARYNIELNVEPRLLPGDAALDLEADLRQSLNKADALASETGAHIIQIGILPTVMPELFEADWMSANLRYAALNEAMVKARGEEMFIDIQGASGERVATYADSIGPESAGTSVQLHLQVPPHEFAANWNAAQALAGPQLAVGANSPFLYGKQLWHETRIELFHQAIDTRPIELKNQGVRPRVFFGEGWITSVFDLFEENVRYFPALIPQISDEDPVATLDAGRTPRLSELRLHNGTVYRWNRPVYDVVNDTPHLRVENRVLPAGPTIIDTMANSAFYFGLLRRLAEDDRPIWTQMSFSAAEQNFYACARQGMAARVYWPSCGRLPADELVLRHLLPMAHQGLERWGVSAEVRDRYLDVIEARCISGVTGATWQMAAVQCLQDRGMDRPMALRGMLERYTQAMHANEPVHTWSLPTTFL
jgi:gamma-glutamyl:cysteine ligase YbdK (ATP-grasp superfamily)